MANLVLPVSVADAFEKLMQMKHSDSSLALTNELSQLRRSLDKNPRNINLLLKSVSSAIRLQAKDVAEIFVRYAIEINPNLAVLHSELGDILKSRGDIQGALVAYKLSLRQDLEKEGLYLNVIGCCLVLKKMDEMVSCLELAVDRFPDNATFLVRLGEARKQQGDIDSAITLFRRAIRLKPEVAYIHQTLSHTKKFTHYDNDIEAMERLLESHTHEPLDEARLYFSLGKAYEDIADFKTSFLNYERGNNQVKKITPYDYSVTASFFESIKEQFNQKLFDQFKGGGYESQTPIFIVSMPRAGSTLVEKILSSHGDVFGAGELGILGDVTTSIWKQVMPAGDSVFPSFANQLSKQLLTRAGKFYLNELEKFADCNEYQRITDKLPHNFLYIGLIKLILPNACILHCHRDPMDTCFSIYKHLFSHPHPYSNDLKELGRYYRLYQDLMSHWHEVLPGMVHDVCYESLIEDPKGQIEKILNFCELPWDDNCLSFHEMRNVSVTASSTQVNRPLYKSALNYSKNYDVYLGPLRETLLK